MRETKDSEECMKYRLGRYIDILDSDWKQGSSCRATALQAQSP
jgi:hypothetical protein